jgi:hypothetical protein
MFLLYTDYSREGKKRWVLPAQFFDYPYPQLLAKIHIYLDWNSKNNIHRKIKK